MNDEPSAVKALVAAFLHENDEVCIISMATNITKYPVRHCRQYP